MNFIANASNYISLEDNLYYVSANVMQDMVYRGYVRFAYHGRVKYIHENYFVPTGEVTTEYLLKFARKETLDQVINDVKSYSSLFYNGGGDVSEEVEEFKYKLDELIKMVREDERKKVQGAPEMQALIEFFAS